MLIKESDTIQICDFPKPKEFIIIENTIKSQMIEQAECCAITGQSGILIRSRGRRSVRFSNNIFRNQPINNWNHQSMWQQVIFFSHRVITCAQSSLAQEGDESVANVSPIVTPKLTNAASMKNITQMQMVASTNETTRRLSHFSPLS